MNRIGMRGVQLLFVLIYIVALSLFSSCVSEELVNNKGEGILRLTIESISGEVSLDSQTKSTASAPQTQLTVPDASEFTVKIIQSDKVIKELPYGAEAIVLEAGDYTVEVYTTKHKDPVAFSSELPDYFVGRSNVNIAPGLPKDLSVTAKWGYAAICPKIEKELSNYFKTYSLIVELEGETSKIVNQDPKDKSLPTFYVLSGKNASIYLEGDNHVTSNKKLLLRTFNPVAEATEYNLSVTAHPDAGVFDFGLVAKVNHTIDFNQNLSGTIVNLEMQTSGIPVDLITNWNAKLVNSDGLEVRSYAGLKNGSATMDEVQGWPYLPQGSYNLKCSYTINGKEVNNYNNPIVVTVPAPDFNVIFAPYTSYDKYLSKDIDGANACDNNKIYNVNGSVNISNELLSNPNYKASFTYTFDGGEPEQITSNSFSKGNVAVNEWKKYKVSVDVMFDGVHKSKVTELHITGLPYNVNPPSNVGNQPWTEDQTNWGVEYFNWRDYEVEMYVDNITGKYIRIGSPEFYILKDLNVEVYVFASGITDMTVIDSNNLSQTITLTSSDTNYHLPDLVLSTSGNKKPKIQIENSRLGGKSRLYVKGVKIIYK